LLVNIVFNPFVHPSMLVPFQKNEILLADMHSKRQEPGLHVWWLGQSGFLLLYEKKCLLFDPYLSDSLTKKYHNTAKPHVRMSELVIAPEALQDIDVVTSSHNHTDHLDAETLVPLLRQNPGIQFIIPEANRDFVAQRVQCAIDFPIGLNDGESVEVGGWAITAVPAAHNTIERDEAGRCRFLGYVARIGPYSVYHSGDTLWYEGMEALLAPFRVDIAFLPINGNDPARGVAGNLNAREAAELGKKIGARWVIPHHYDMFEFNTADPGDFVAACEKVGQPYRVLSLGACFTITEHGIF
jgi:L-ascorbate metabolism protein UlaG (beta-lactamase superfamily)